MPYTVLARRYRSTNFEQVIGQEPIAQTLKNAIALGRVAHAYLFMGTRGVGKTSMARIFAAALNAPDTIDHCPRLPGKRDYPPQDVQQRMAEAIRRGDDLNVIEIDGASNRSVDEARQLIANAGLAPTGNAQFKIYIIDEVHMLTREAFNALLKTMEEPPAHVKFILCTTEAHKIPATIQSRCQRFDFQNIPTATIAKHLEHVLKQENIPAQQQVVWQVARLGNGSMRDALSLLDRLIAAAGIGGEETPNDKPLSLSLLEEMLGLPNQTLIVQLVDALAQGQIKPALQRTADLLSHGVAQDQLIETLIEHLRQLMLIVACGPDSGLIELSDQARADAAKQAQAFDASGLVYMIALCENLQRASKHSATPRALLDATIVRLALAEKMADITTLLTAAATTGAPTTGVPKITAPPQGRKKKVIPNDLSRPAASTPPQPIPTTSRDRKGAVQGHTINHAHTPSPASQPDTIPDIPPHAAWSKLLEQVDQKPAMAWARQLGLKRFDQGVAYLAPLPGQRELAGFVTQPRREQLAEMLKSITGRPIRVELEPITATTLNEAHPTNGHTPPTPGPAPSTTDQAAPHAHTPTPTRPGGPTPSDRQQALALPLVKQIMDVFDATLVDAQPADTKQAPDPTR